MPAAKSANKKMEKKETTPTTPAAQPVMSTTSVTKKSKKETKKETIPVVEPVVEVTKTQPESSVETTKEDNLVISEETLVNEGFTEFINKFQAMITQFNSLKNELKTLEKRTMKQLKVVQKLNNKKRKKATRAPSGFVKPAPISKELADFLGKPEGTEMARTDVTREINKYIRANDLQDKNNGRKIIPDKALSALLKIEDEVILTYFNLQRYMGPHFPKQTKPEATPTVSA
jgi:chromatin remodeling complex protein RSC6